MRFSIKDLCGIVAFCAVLAWCASRIGFTHPMFWAFVCVSAVLSAAFVYVARKEKRGRATLLVSLLLFLIGSFTGPAALMLNAFLLFWAGVFGACRPPLPRRALVVTVMVCTAISAVAGTIPGVLALRTLRELRQEFPIVSLQERLGYEQRPRREASTAVRITTGRVLSELVRFEDSLHTDFFREARFKRLHDQQSERFVRATGFGVGRMPRPSLALMRRTPLRDIAFDEEPDKNSDSAYNSWRALLRLKKKDSVEHLHMVSRNDFLDPVGFGANIEGIRRVVGFVEHAFHYSPKAGVEDRETWHIERIELVSLLKFDEPRVYLLDHLPRMDQFSGGDVPTRPLDDFESDALSRLWTDEDIVVRSVEHDVRMLGSLRAAKQCLECHQGPRGALLGAFSYQLRRVGRPKES